MGGASRCGDLGPCWRATQMAGNRVAYADRLLPSEGIGEDLTPLTRACPRSPRSWPANGAHWDANPSKLSTDSVWWYPEVRGDFAETHATLVQPSGVLDIHAPRCRASSALDPQDQSLILSAAEPDGPRLPYLRSSRRSRPRPRGSSPIHDLSDVLEASGYVRSSLDQ